MSREVTFIATLSVAKSGLAFTYPQVTLRPNMSGWRIVSNVQPITPTISGLNAAGQTSFVPGYAQFTNLSRESGVDILIGVSTGTWAPFMSLGSGQVGIMPLNNLNLAAQTTMGTGNLYYTFIER